jgi:hypothetical protein
MIESLQRAAAPARDRLTTEVADLRFWTPVSSEDYDLIVTHFFLDCLATEEIAGLAQRLASVLARGAVWLVSEFAVPPTVFGRAVAGPLVAALYRAFGLLTKLRQRSLPDHARALSGSGWELAKQRSHLGGLLVSQLWQFRQE